MYQKEGRREKAPTSTVTIRLVIPLAPPFCSGTDQPDLQVSAYPLTLNTDS